MEGSVVVGPLLLQELKYAFIAEREIGPAVPGEDVPKLPEFGDVDDVLYWYFRSNGERAGTEVDLRVVFTGGWSGPGFWYLAAWNDYTGWGCGEGASFRWAAKLDDLIQFGLEREDRERWGLA